MLMTMYVSMLLIVSTHIIPGNINGVDFDADVDINVETKLVDVGGAVDLGVEVSVDFDADLAVTVDVAEIC